MRRKLCLHYNNIQINSKCFGTVEGCQQHMKDQRHCRLPVANEDLYFDEYGEYYDFSTEESSTKVKLLFFFFY